LVDAHSLEVRMNPPRPTTRQVFDAHAAYALRVLRYLGVREADLHDVCQEVFITVHRKLDAFEGRSEVRTWLYAICRNAASDYRRRAHVRREVPAEEPERGAPELASLEPVSRLEARSRLQLALDALDERARELFVLYEIEGLTMPEIAEVLECPVQTLYSRLHAARKAVLSALGRDEEGA